MSLKDEYIRMRNKKEYNLDFFFKYYLEKGGKITNPNDFTERFLFTHMEQPTFHGQSVLMRTGEVDKQEVIRHMDGVFGLSILEDKDGNFIKVVI